MCGIVGLYNLPRVAHLLPDMLGAIAHRGPDAEGIYTGEHRGVGVQLGHRRLSIIDLSEAANQPFEKHDFVLVYNGEIYNYKELSAELKTRGVRFRTTSDTEVLLEAWREWGPDCLTRLRGMFAFALLNKKTGQMFLARDPFGIKPLFFTVRHGGLAFGSELKALSTALRDELQIDHTALVSSLMYYWVPERQCVFKGVEKLPPGHWAEMSPDGTFQRHSYFDPQRELIHSKYSDLGADELRGIIEDSVEAHLVADVPVSAFLSGGLDSSLLTAIAAGKGYQIEGYTISFREDDRRLEAMPDDLFYARKIAKQYDIPLHEIEIAPDIADMLPKMVQFLDEPIGDAAAINAYLICQAARESGVKVLLSGMGADELFGGYRKHYACMLASQYRKVPQILRNGVVRPIVDALPVAGRKRGYRTARWAKRFLSFADMPEEAAYRRSYTHYGVPEFGDLLHPDHHGSVDQLVDEHAEIYGQYKNGNSGDAVNSMCYTDLRHFLPGLNLAYTDRASMAASTEVRVPYVDKEVVAAAFAIAGKHKIVGRETKSILKKAAEPWLPREVIYRPKGLFSAPLRAWIRRDLKVMVEDLLMHGNMVKSGFLNRDYLRGMVDEDRAGTADRSKEIWQLMTLETWLQQQKATL